MTDPVTLNGVFDAPAAIVETMTDRERDAARIKETVAEAERAVGIDDDEIDALIEELAREGVKAGAR